MNIFGKKPLALACFLFLISVIIGRLIPSKICFAISAVTFFLTLIFFFTVKTKKIKVKIALIAIFIIAGYLHSAFFSFWRKDNVEIYENTDTPAKIEAVVISRKYYSNYLTVVEIDARKINGEDVNIKMLKESDFASDVRAGDLICFEAFLSEFQNTEEFNEKQYYNSKGIYLRAEELPESCEILQTDVQTVSIFFGKINSKMSDIITKRLDKSSAALANAVFLGDRSSLENVVKRDFKRTGTYHLLALSGLHLSVLSVILDTVLLRLGIKKGYRYAVLPIFLTFYVAVTGFGVSVVRSAIMLFLTYVAYWVGKRKDPLTSLMIAATLIMLFSPESVFDVSLWLSISSTFGIIIFSPFSTWVSFKLRKIKSKRLRKAVNYIVSSFITSFSAMLMVLPLSCFYFDGFSIVGAVMTLILSPFISFILFISPLLLIFRSFDCLSKLFSFVLEKACHIIIESTSFASDLDNIYIPFDHISLKIIVLLFFIGFAFLLVINLKRKYLIALFVAVFVAALSVAKILVINLTPMTFEYVLDKNNEYIVFSENGDNVLVDISDGSFSSLSGAAKNASANGLGELDVLVLTHLHQKHIGSFYKLCQNYMVRTVLIPSPINEKEKEIALSILSEAESEGIACQIYRTGGLIKIFDKQSIVLSRDYIKRSTHPALMIDMSGEIGISYIGSSYPELGGDILSKNHIILATHGPICKNDFMIPIGDDTSYVFIADSEIAEYAKIGTEKLSDHRVIKDVSYIKITSEAKRSQ